MYITRDELEKKKVLWHGFSSGYDLGNGLIAKKYNFINQELLQTNIQKIILANQYQWINGLVAPLDYLQLEDGIMGFVMQKKNARPFPDFYNKSVDGPTLEDIVDYIVKVERILKKCHQEDMFFPDLASGNVLYNPQTKEVFIIDYDGAQIRSLKTGDISNIIYNTNKELLESGKYYPEKRYNKNIDIFTLVVRFFYYATKVDIGKNLKAGLSLDEIFDLVNLQDKRIRDIIRMVYDRSVDNSYVGEALQELNSNYSLTKKVLGRPRSFVRK